MIMIMRSLLADERTDRKNGGGTTCGAVRGRRRKPQRKGRQQRADAQEPPCRVRGERGASRGDASQSLVVAQSAADAGDGQLYDRADEQRSKPHKRPPDGKEGRLEKGQRA